jgi:hypothetical protein
MRPVYERDEAMKAGRPGPRVDPDSKTRKSFLLNLFARIHGKSCAEYRDLESVLFDGLGMRDVQALAFAEYLDLRTQQIEGRMEAETAVPLRLRLLETLRKLAPDEAPEDVRASLLRVEITHRSEEERAANRGPGAVIE